MDLTQRPLSGFSSRSYGADGLITHAAVTRFSDWQTVAVDIANGTWTAGTTDRGDNWVGTPATGKVAYHGTPVEPVYGQVVARLLSVLKANIGRAVHVSTPIDNARGESWSETVIAVDERTGTVYVYDAGIRAVMGISGNSLIARYAGRIVEPAY